METEIELAAQEGVPSGDRTEIYMKYFDIEGKESQFQQVSNEILSLGQMFSKLEKEAEAQEIFYDEILQFDSQEILEDERYFVFQEEIHKMLKVLIRDKSYKEKLFIYMHNFDIPFKNEYGLTYPVCGFLPGKNISRYMAPFCYMSTKIYLNYAIFSEFFSRYFCFLHAISSNPNSITSLCVQFEDIIQTLSPKLFAHLKEIGCDALKIVMPMIINCFIGYFEVEQIFQIFDRIIGFGSLDILVLISVGVLLNKKGALLMSKGQTDVDECLGRIINADVFDLIMQTLQEI